VSLSRTVFAGGGGAKNANPAASVQFRQRQNLGAFLVA
jgi:hypothetical protein